jgi:branched-chain amino acid transport system permease protein
MRMRRDYYEDVQLLRGGVQRFWFVVLLAFLAALPFLLPGYLIYACSFLAVNVIAVLGLNIVTGFTGQISLGQAGFLAIGAYTTVLLMTHAPVPFPLALLLGALLAAGIGFLLGFPALRLEGPYLAVVTLGFGLAVIQVIARGELFGGRMGLHVPTPALGPWPLVGDRAIYAVVVTLAVIATVAARNLMRTRVGRAMQAIRDSDIAAEALGVHVAWYKTLSFALAAFYGGLAGGLLALLLGFINPEQFTFLLSVVLLAGATVGGLGSVLGSVLGGVLVGLLGLYSHAIAEAPLIGRVVHALSEHVLSVGGAANASWVLTGVVLIVIVLFEPLGLHGMWLRARRYWGSWPF